MNNESEFNCLCLSCKKLCKQSSKVLIIECPVYEYNGCKVIKHKSERAFKERELSSQDKREIKKLVKQCANFNCEEQICLPLDGACFMLQKAFTGTLCKYFKNAILPLNPSLERLLKRNSNSQKTCGICGNIFNAEKNKRYCSEKCKDMAKKQADRERARNYRNRKS